MYIKKIVIDGFKSYGQRTEVGPFDPEFNAITGLNGSGKSNILDSICFLLGITNLSCVRAGSLQELVYKNGQAGITRATVTIIFDNKDKKQSPMGYDHFDEISVTRQVVIGGKNKYLLNGTNIQNQRIQDLFRSVQLNVNNPHFLIMQGRITKVLNMKPPEILAMIEEAAGTMLYESKKQNAEKTIAKKDSKLREINGILDEDITPTLNRLKEERATYLEFQKIQREYEHLHKLHVAFSFVQAEEIAQQAQSGVDEVRDELNQVEEQIEAGKNEIIKIQEKIELLNRLRDEELGGKLNQLEDEQRSKEKESLQVSTKLKSAKDNVKQEERKMNQTVKGMTSDKKHYQEKKKIADGMQAKYDELRHHHEKVLKEEKEAKDRFEAISVGKFTSEDGKADTLQGQIMKHKEEISNAQTTIKTHEMKIKHNDKQIKRLESEIKKSDSDFKKDSANLKKYEEQVAYAEKELSKLDYEDGQFEQLEDSRQNLRHELQAQKRKVDQISVKVPWINFHYTDPEKNFDRSQVRGVAASLMKVKNDKFFVALDIAGGSKLFYVIVTSSKVASLLMKRGNLARRTIFIPLDTISARCISKKELQVAEKLVGNDNVWRAIDLVEFDDDLRPAMEFVLGNVLICTDLNVANKLAYNKNVRRLCVTLEGDKVNPSGEMSGGSAPTGGSKLTQIAAINETKAKYDELRDGFEKVEVQLKKLQPVAKLFNQLKEQFETRTHELAVLRERLSHTDHQRKADELKGLKDENTQMAEEIKGAKITDSEGNKKVKELEYKIKNAKQLKEKELKDAEAEVKKCTKAVAKSKKEWSDKEAEERELKGDIADLEKTIKQAEEQIEACREAMDGFDQEIVDLEKELTVAQNAVQAAKDSVKAQKEAVIRNNKEINAEAAKSDKIVKQNSDRELKVKELNIKISKVENDAKESTHRVQRMLEKYEWIGVDRKFFGEPGSAYDFNATDMNGAEKRLRKLEENKKKLEETVNMRAMTMLDKAEVQYNELMRKKATVENDKAKIKKVIEKLDVKKKDELRKAYEKVNLDFGSIFQSLLPGTAAKLKPPDGMDVLDGLEVKIAFGGIWKDSLSELSGGQRSLVALSLILSLLRFKPAPLYILDEVDAALDLSHTQNIGNMLKKHFQNSQFIVVSLKDGMFNNANVLFKTKFVDGMSTVSRGDRRNQK